MTIEQQVAQRLIDTKKTLAIAESCTGGLLTHRLTNISGSSSFLKVGVIGYDNQAKIKLLKVPSQTIKNRGAVSQETTVAMAKGVQRILHTDWAVSVTGIAGPKGATKTKPIGLVYIALVTPRKKISHFRFHFKGSRESIKRQASTQALLLLNDFIRSFYSK